jgi:hypothetical protein
MEFITQQGLSAEAVKRKLGECIQPVEKLWKTAVFALIDRIFEQENLPRTNLSSPLFATAYNESLSS